MKKIDVKLPHHRYDILIGQGLLDQLGDKVRPLMKRAFAAVVTDENVGKIYRAKVEAALHAAGIECVFITVRAGEASKSWPVLEQVVEGLLDAKIERDDLVIALGGGVIGDLVGFAASVLRRGVRFVQVPTSLLAQVDSSVGGKTGINSSHGKNLIGAFHQPELVVIDIDVLKTLPHREFLAGYGEVVKYGMLGDAEFFQWLDEHHNEISGLEPNAITEMVAHCCQMKADIVERDEKEHGDRALLNLGHTFGHALEKVTGYSDTLLHGEGVAIGCGLAFDLSAKLGYCNADAGARARGHLVKMGMKSHIKDIQKDAIKVDDLVSAMYQDKKVQSGALTFILAHELGNAFVARSIEESMVREVLEEHMK